MTLEIRNTRDDLEKSINFIIYGESGVGKTSLIKQFPCENVLVLSAEDGLLSIADHPVDYVKIKTLDDVNFVINNILKDEHKFIFIDSITELSQNHYNLLNDKYKIIAEEKGKDVSSYGLKLWGDFSSDFSRTLKNLRGVNRTVIALSLEKSKEDDIGRENFMPDIYGKTAERIIAWFDECFRYFIHDGKRVFLTEKTEISWAKDRSGKLKMIEEANLYDLFVKITS